MTKYADLDAAILKAISNGTDTMMVMANNKDLCTGTLMFRSRTKPHYRVIDGRLQALRKAGKIAFVAQKWHVMGVSK